VGWLSAIIAIDNLFNFFINENWSALVGSSSAIINRAGIEGLQIQDDLKWWK